MCALLNIQIRNWFNEINFKSDCINQINQCTWKYSLQLNGSKYRQLTNNDIPSSHSNSQVCHTGICYTELTRYSSHICDFCLTTNPVHDHLYLPQDQQESWHLMREFLSILLLSQLWSSHICTSSQIHISNSLKLKVTLPTNSIEAKHHSNILTLCQKYCDMPHKHD